MIYRHSPPWWARSGHEIGRPGAARASLVSLPPSRMHGRCLDRRSTANAGVSPPGGGHRRGARRSARPRGPRRVSAGEPFDLRVLRRVGVRRGWRHHVGRDRCDQASPGRTDRALHGLCSARRRPELWDTGRRRTTTSSTTTSTSSWAVSWDMSTGSGGIRCSRQETIRDARDRPAQRPQR